MAEKIKVDSLVEKLATEVPYGTKVILLKDSECLNTDNYISKGTQVFVCGYMQPNNNEVYVIVKYKVASTTLYAPILPNNFVCL